MHLTTPNIFISLVTTFILVAFFSLYLTRQQTWTQSSPNTAFTNLLLRAESPLPSVTNRESPPPLPQQAPPPPLDICPVRLNSDAILLPDWEVLIVFSPGLVIPSTDHLTCLFQDGHTSPAIPTGVTTFNNRATFKCLLPDPVRHFSPPLRPVLTDSLTPFPQDPQTELFPWTFLTYESISTKTDVILFVKGVNSRQAINRLPKYLTCVFSNGVNHSVKTPVFTSKQEVFRCLHPDSNQLPSGDIKVSLEMKPENKIVPSVAYYTPPPPGNHRKPKSLICACTMVYNVAKFLKEWVLYNAKIGVDKFFLYNNASDDDLDQVVDHLTRNGFSVETILWPWSKTQEAGFSHCATYANDTCTWMMYVDVDEFFFSPSWHHAPSPSSRMLKSLLPKTPLQRYSKHSHSQQQIGQVMIMCHDFGPSNQRSHPVQGVTQGYTCRSRGEQRHKSIVLLDAIDDSLMNVVHHFELKKGYRGKKLSLGQGIVNHYKFQAWSEFKNKFKRRVSAYVVDWRQGVNPKSKDRTPGLGFEPVEPKGWANKFCSVHDNRLKDITTRWFGSRRRSSNKMAWQEL